MSTEKKLIIDFNSKEEHQAIERHYLEPGIYPGKMIAFKQVRKPAYRSEELETSIIIEVLIQDKKIPYFISPSITAYGPSKLYRLLEVTDCLEDAKKAHENNEFKSVDDIVNFLDAQLDQYESSFLVKTVKGETNYSVIKEIVKVMK